MAPVSCIQKTVDREVQLFFSFAVVGNEVLNSEIVHSIFFHDTPSFAMVRTGQPLDATIRPHITFDLSCRRGDRIGPGPVEIGPDIAARPADVVADRITTAAVRQLHHQK